MTSTLGRARKRERGVSTPDFYQTTLSYVDFGCEHYGLPHYSCPTVTYFNKSLFQKSGDKTPDQDENEGELRWKTLLHAP